MLSTLTLGLLPAPLKQAGLAAAPGRETRIRWNDKG